MNISSQRRRSGFTLVELLVVLAIITVLISVLLPAILKARQSAYTVKCAANIRSILQSLALYTSQYKGFIPGSPNTTGLPLFSPPYSEDDCPEISQIFDYQAPLARQMGLPFNTEKSSAARTDRYVTLVGSPVFRCPSNDFTAVPTPSTGLEFGSSPWNSYSTAVVFLYKNTASGTVLVGQTHAQSEYEPPSGYFPRITKVGNPAAKIFIADGARFIQGAAPTADVGYLASYGGAYSDVGPWMQMATLYKAWDRSLSPGNGGVGIDGRRYTFRHGSSVTGGKADSYRINVGFFDGHVATMGDLEASDPSMWVPRGTRITVSAAYPDVRNKYFANLTGSFVAP